MINNDQRWSTNCAANLFRISCFRDEKKLVFSKNKTVSMEVRVIFAFLRNFIQYKYSVYFEPRYRQYSLWHRILRRLQYSSDTQFYWESQQKLNCRNRIFLQGSLNFTDQYLSHVFTQYIFSMCVFVAISNNKYVIFPSIYQVGKTK